MKNIIIFGYGLDGVNIWRQLERTGDYNLLGFADNSMVKQGKMASGEAIKSLKDLEELKSRIPFSVVIASSGWVTIKKQLEERQIEIEGLCIEHKLVKYKDMASFDKLDCSKPIFLYAGDITDKIHMDNINLFGLSISKMNERHIFHDITQKYPLPDESIFAYQAEDVLEHIEKGKVVSTLNEIYRILKKGSVLRICLPDYNSPYLNKISMKDNTGSILFDPTGGGSIDEYGVINGGHLWFPTYEQVRELLEQSYFKKINFLCYHTEKGELVRKKIDYINGYVRRVSDIENKQPTYSIIVDCEKSI